MFLVLATVAKANVTTPFEQAMIGSNKIVRAEILSITKTTLTLKIVEVYKGELTAAKLSVPIPRFFKGGNEQDTCFLLLDKQNKVYKTGLGCGEHSILLARNAKIINGIYRYALNKNEKAKSKLDFSKNSEDFDTVAEVSDGIKSHLRVLKKGSS